MPGYAIQSILPILSNLLQQSKSTSLLMVWRADCFQIKFCLILGELLHLLAQHLAEVLVSFAEVLDDAVLEERR